MNELPRVPVPPRVWWREFRTRVLLPLLSVAAVLLVAHLWPQVISSRLVQPIAAEAQPGGDGYLVGMKVDGHHSRKKSAPVGQTNLPFPTPLAMTNGTRQVLQ